MISSGVPTVRCSLLCSFCVAAMNQLVMQEHRLDHGRVEMDVGGWLAGWFFAYCEIIGNRNIFKVYISQCTTVFEYNKYSELECSNVCILSF